MKSFAIVTPTYNREKTLGRLYQSIANQTFPFSDFSWIVVDDGSTDGTKSLLDTLIPTSPFEIKYLYKPNGGKHTAWKYAVEYLRDKDYKYFISIDSDDELTPDALQIFYSHWLELEDNDEIGLINARTLVSGALDVPHNIFENRTYVDDTYHNVVLRYGEQSEMITSIKVSDLDRYLNIPDYFWLSDKVKFFSENILWGRAARLTKTRYLKKVLRIVHQDAENQISHNKSRKGTSHLYNYIVGIKYFISENFDYIVKYQKKQMLLDITKYAAMCAIVGIDYRTAFKELNIPVLKALYIILWPISLIVVLWFYLKRYL